MRIEESAFKVVVTRVLIRHVDELSSHIELKRKNITHVDEDTMHVAQGEVL